MTRVSIDIQGGAQLEAALKKLGKDGQDALSKVVIATGIELRGDIVKKYQRGPASGRVYQRGNIIHQASAPGEAPATDTGRLASSVEFRTQNRFNATVGSNVVYGAFLEWGTRNIAPRPAWRPAVEDAGPKYVKRLEDALQKVMK
jgi:hypothetical protein